MTVYPLGYSAGNYKCLLNLFKTVQPLLNCYTSRSFLQVKFYSINYILNQLIYNKICNFQQNTKLAVPHNFKEFNIKI